MSKSHRSSLLPRLATGVVLLLGSVERLGPNANVPGQGEELIQLVRSTTYEFRSRKKNRSRQLQRAKAAVCSSALFAWGASFLVATRLAVLAANRRADQEGPQIVESLTWEGLRREAVGPISG